MYMLYLVFTLIYYTKLSVLPFYCEKQYYSILYYNYCVMYFDILHAAKYTNICDDVTYSPVRYGIILY